jgi:hypothetical protein
MLCK